MARLPQPGSDAGNWGAILNEFLSQAHQTDGSLKDDIITETQLAPAVVAKINSVAGPTGATGPEGPMGASGGIGATGAQGIQGTQGATGVQGATGATGPAGNDGTSVTITGSVATAASLPTGLTSGDAGQGYLTQDDGHLHVWSGTAWTDVGLVRGPAGPTGPTGVSGSQGATGATGPGVSYTVTSVKTANYTAVANDYIPVNTTSGSVTITLPTAPADGALVAVKVVAGTNACIVSRGGTDVFNIASGATTLTLSTAGIGVNLRYTSATGIWYSMDATPLSALNGVYAPSAGPVPALYAASADPRFVSATAGRKVTDFTLALGDAGTIIEAEAATSITATVPPGSSVAFIDNTLIEICQTGDGQVTVAPGAGVTLRAPGGLKTRAKWSSISLRRRPGSGSSLPTANLLMRFKADDISGTNGSAVASWPESSGNNLPAATQAISANQPTLIVNAINGHKAVNFDGVNDFLHLNGSALDVARNKNALTVFIVYSYPSNFSGTRSFMYLSSGTSSSSSRVYMGLKDSSGNLGVGGRRLDTDGATFITSAAPVVGEVAVSTARFVYSSKSLYLYKNGTLSASTTNFSTTGSTSDTSSLAGVIGSNLAGTAENLPARIAEIMIYGQDDDTMRAAVHTYIQSTYGISVADATGVVDEWVVSGDTTV